MDQEWVQSSFSAVAFQLSKCLKGCWVQLLFLCSVWVARLWLFQFLWPLLRACREAPASWIPGVTGTQTKHYQQPVSFQDLYSIAMDYGSLVVRDAKLPIEGAFSLLFFSRILGVARFNWDSAGFIDVSCVLEARSVKLIEHENSQQPWPSIPKEYSALLSL